MKTKLFLISPILITVLTINALGQNTIYLTFTAQHNGHHVSLDSILIMNLTQGGETWLYDNDTVLELDINTSLNEYNLSEKNSFTVSPNYPNPFVGQTSIDIRIVEEDNIVIRVFDLSGREHASYEGVFDGGKHTFKFYPGNESFYIFSAFYRGLTRSIKIVNQLSDQTDCKVTYMGFERYEGKLKLHPDEYFPFSLGDTLRYIGYSITTSITPVRGSDVIEEDIPLENKTYVFDDVTEGVPCVDVPTVTYDSQVYNTVRIGTQCWLKENLNVGTMIPGGQYQVNNDTIEKYCYDNASYNCANYGGLYQWDEIMDYSNQAGAQGICPPGWHIPTDEEFKQLEGEVDSQYGYPDPVWDTLGQRGYDVGLMLKSRNGWNNGSGIDAFGFTALATGCYVFWYEIFLSKNIYTSFWTSVELSSFDKWYRYLNNYHSQSARYPRRKHMGRSVRCLKDQ